MHFHHRVRLLLIGFASCLATLPAAAQSWPQRTVRLICSLGPGSGADIVARVLAEPLQKRWGQPVIVENRPGGDGIPAVVQLTSAKDDHTMMVAPSGTFASHPIQHAKLPYDPRDVLPVARVSNTVLVFAVPASLAVSTMSDVVALARKEPGKLNWHAVASQQDLLMQGYLKTTGLDMVRVPYRDGVQALNDLVESRLHFYSSSFAIVRPQALAGTIKVIALSNSQRTDTVPGVSTIAEQGHPLLELDGLIGFLATPAMNERIRESVARDINELTRLPEVTARLTATAQIVNPGNPAEFALALDRQRNVVAETARVLGHTPRQ